MKTAHLHDVWASPDNSRLTTKQLSFRLPVHIAARVAALCEMYPQKNRTQIVADLLNAALNDLEANLPEAVGRKAESRYHREVAEENGHPKGEPLYFLGGPRGEFRDLANKHYKELEAELGNPDASQLFHEILGSRQFFTQK